LIILAINTWGVTFLLLLAVEKLRRDPGLDDRPGTGPSDVPALSTSSEADVNSGNLVGSAGSSSRVDVPQQLQVEERE